MAGENAIGILIQSRNQALAGIRETTVALKEVAPALAPIAPAANLSAQALETAARAMADVSGAARGLEVGPQLGQLAQQSQAATGSLSALDRISESFNASLRDLRGGVTQGAAALDQVARAAAQAGEGGAAGAAGLSASQSALQGVGEAAGGVSSQLQAAGQSAELTTRALESQADGGRDAGRSLDDLRGVAEDMGNAAGRITGGILEAAAGLDDLVRAATSAGGAAQESNQDIQASAAATAALSHASEDAAAAMSQEAAAAGSVSAAARVKGAAEDSATAASHSHAAAQRELATESREGAVGLLAVREALSEISPEAAGAAGQLERMVLLLGRLPLEAAVFTGIGLAAAGATGGLLAMGESLAKEVQGLENLNRATGSSVDDLQTLREVLKEEGLSFDTILTPLTNLNREIAKGNPLLEALGVSARDPIEALLQLSRALEGSNDEQAKAEIVERLLGGRSRELLAVISDLATKFPQARAELQRLGDVIEGDTIRQVDELRKQTEQLSTSWDGVWKDMRAVAVPGAQVIVFGLQGIIDGFKGVASAAEAAGEASKRALAELTAQKDVAPAPADAGFLLPAHGPGAPGQEVPGAFVGPVATAQILAQADAIAAAHERAAAAAKKHADLVRELEDAFHSGAAEAEAFAKSLENIARQKTVEDTLQAIANAQGGVSEQLARLGATHLDHLIGPEIPKEIERANKAAEDFNAKLNETVHLTGLSPAAILSVLKIGDASHATAKELEAGVSQMEALRQKTEELSQASGLNPALVASLVAARDATLKAIEAFAQLGQVPPVELVRQNRSEQFDLQNLQRQEEIADPDRIRQVVETWKTSADDIVSSATVVNDTLGNVFNALQSSFSQVFANLLTQGQTFATALHAIFKGLVEAILQELAKLVAAQVFKLFLKIAGTVLGGPIGAVAAVADLSGGSGFGPGGPIPTPFGPPAPFAVPAPPSPDLQAPSPTTFAAASRTAPEEVQLQQAPGVAAASATTALPSAEDFSRSVSEAIAESRAITGGATPRLPLGPSADDLRSISQAIVRAVTAAKLPTEAIAQQARIALTPPASRPQDPLAATRSQIQPTSAPAAAPSSQKPNEKRVLEQHITIQVQAIDAAGVSEFFSSPLGKGRLAQIANDASAGF